MEKCETLTFQQEEKQLAHQLQQHPPTQAHKIAHKRNEKTKWMKNMKVPKPHEVGW